MRRRLLDDGSALSDKLEYIELEVPLPQQITSEEEKEQIESAANSAERILLIQLVGPLFL